VQIFLFEYLHFLTASFAILVSVSAAILFLLTFNYEKKLRTAWRAAGFIALAVAFFFFILERKFADFALPGLLLELLGFYSIYKGILAEPKLSHLQKEGDRESQKKLQEQVKKGFAAIKHQVTAYILVMAIFSIIYIFAGPYLAALVIALSLFFIFLTIQNQIHRYLGERSRQNIYPLAAYLFLFLAGLMQLIYRLPELNIVAIRKLTSTYSISWQLSLLLTFTAFFLLAIWIWNFIKVRPFLRIYVVFLTFALVVSSLGSLVFTTLFFRVVEANNLQLMTQGTQAEYELLQNRANNALFLARTIATNDTFLTSYKKADYFSVEQLTKELLKNSGADTLRVYNSFGEVIASPSDPRDKGRLFNKDNLVAAVISNKQQVKSFDTEASILAPVLVTRAAYPLLEKNQAIGLIEVRYKFDNAFVDALKERTGLDATIYIKEQRSATTIKTLDGVSRWIGSRETEPAVIQNVLEQGKEYGTIVDRLGISYYSAFAPIRNINGEIIGMISLGTPTSLLFEDTRQQLLSSFLITIVISLITALLGYLAINSFRKNP